MNSGKETIFLGKKVFRGLMLPAQKLEFADNDKLISRVKSTWLEQQVITLQRTKDMHDTTPLILD